MPRGELAERMRYAVEMAGLDGREDALVSTLAGGWKQRLALGCAILHRPPILFLDEPTSGVEPESRRRFWDLIHALAAEGVTVLVSTHYMDEAEYCNRIALINPGRLVAIGSPGELRRTALGGELLLVECERLGPTLAALPQAPGRARCRGLRQRTACACASRAQPRRTAGLSRRARDSHRAASRPSRRPSRTCSCSSIAADGAGGERAA